MTFPASKVFSLPQSMFIYLLPLIRFFSFLDKSDCSDGQKLALSLRN